MRTLARKPLYLLSVLVLSACGGGGGSGTEPKPVPSGITAVSKITTDTSNAYKSDEEAILEVALSAELVRKMQIQAASSNSQLKILSREIIAESQDGTYVKFTEIKTNESCLDKNILSTGESCVDRWKVSTTKQEYNYTGKVVYTTTAGSPESKLNFIFKMPDDPEFEKDKFSISHIDPIGLGDEFSLSINNATAKAINNPKVTFPSVISPFITQSTQIAEIKSGESAKLSFILEDSTEAQLALKKWQAQLDEANPESYITYSSARFKTQAYQLQPQIHLSDLTSSLDNIDKFTEVNGKLEANVSLLNVSNANITGIQLSVSPQTDAISLDVAACDLPLLPNKSCMAKVVIDPSISHEIAGKESLILTLQTADVSNRDSINLTVAVDGRSKIELAQDSTFLANHDNQIFFENTGFMDWVPSTDSADYKVIDGNGNDVSSRFDIKSATQGSNCLSGEPLKKGDSCAVLLRAQTDESGNDLFLKLEGSNADLTSHALPGYSSNGISANNSLNSKYVIINKPLSVFYTVAPPEEQIVKGFTIKDASGEVIHGVVQDTDYPQSCIIDQTIASIHNPCQLKLDIPKEAIVLSQFAPTVVIEWKDGTSSDVHTIIGVIDPQDPDADISGLFSFMQLSGDLTYIDANENGLQIKLNNTTDTVISGFEVEILPQWLRDIVDISSLSKITIPSGQEIVTHLGLQIDKTADDLAAALKDHLTAVVANANEDETGGQVIRFKSSNAVMAYHPAIEVDLFPYIDTQEENARQTLTQRLVFDKPALQYIEVVNPTEYRHILSFSEALPMGINRVTEGGISGLVNCSGLLDQLLPKARCAVIFEAQSDANVSEGDHLDIMLTPEEGAITQTTTLQIDFQTNYVYSIGYQPESSAIELPISGNKVYNLKLVNNEEAMQWLPSSNMTDYVLHHHQGIDGLHITGPTQAPSCMDGDTVASGGYCYIGLEVRHDAGIQNDYQLSLQMGQSNLAVETLAVGEVSIVDHGKASVQLQKNGQSISSVQAGELVEIGIIAPENWYTSTENDQIFSINASNPAISFPNGNTCKLSVANQDTQCLVAIAVDRELSSGVYNISIDPDETTDLPIGQVQINMSVLAKSAYNQIMSGSKSDTACAKTLDNKIYCWGYNGSSGKLGNDTDVLASLLPTALKKGQLPAVEDIKKLSQGWVHACALATNGKAYCWGSNSSGQLGNADYPENAKVPVEVSNGDIPASAQLKNIAAGERVSCAVDDQNNIYCWGRNYYKLIKNSSQESFLLPTKISKGQIPSAAEITDIELGFAHACVLTNEKKAYCWGSGENGQLGNGGASDSPAYPRAVSQSGIGFNMIATGALHTCALSDNKQDIYCWGRKSTLGSFPNEQQEKPTQVNQTIIPSGTLLNKITAGHYHACALADDGQAYCWGMNAKGQLGVGHDNTEYRAVVVKKGKIPSDVALIDITAGDHYTCGIGSDNQSYCWGDNNYGQLGDGTKVDRYTPVLTKPAVD
ncbi:RCC1 domain-containing protein [Cysteiniphilum halobium]|uniref:RCC1 domain-containing protein n=1 Tax=Cysteiniphilum halobium TaxID=2219059 RepID=UPI000E658691|nr:hypothetical protein [Cysteiniphilum halobium]